MALYKLDIQFSYNLEYWTNKLYIQAAEDEGAAQDAIAIAGVLRTGIQNQVTIDKIRVTPAPFTANNFFDVPIDLPGTGGTTPPAPLFNVVRWVFSPPRGRSTNHYFRGGVTPSNIGADGNFTDAAEAFNNSLVNQLFDLPSIIVSKAGVPYQGANAARKVGMRQLRRGSKRVKTPVI